MLYWCYGSNLNVEQMKVRCPKARPLGAAELKNYTLKFCRRGGAPGVATVEAHKGETVPGGLWEITYDCLEALDRYEGWPTLYDCIDVRVRTPDGNVRKAMTYYMVNDPPESAPSAYYLQVIAQGYRDFGLDIEKLKDFANR